MFTINVYNKIYNSREDVRRRARGGRVLKGLGGGRKGFREEKLEE